MEPLDYRNGDDYKPDSDDLQGGFTIRPYPVEYMKPWRFDDGTEILIRPIRPDDEPLMVRFHATLSEQSVYLRYFHMIKLDHRASHERLARICQVDYDSEMVLVAERRVPSIDLAVNPDTAAREILAVGRLNKAPEANEAEFAMLIGDTFQHHGLGTEMLRRLLEFARAEKLARVTADILFENDHMAKVCKLLGFSLHYSLEERVIKAELML